MHHSFERVFERVREELGASYAPAREIGRGGMAVVFLAEDRKHHRWVAVKILRPDIASGVTAQRFLREIRLAARLTHPNILPVLDSGVCDNLPFYVMPFVEGESLQQRLARTTTISLDDTIGIVRQVADALDYAHAAGIVHRDIKPGNILLVGEHAIIADFGIARGLDAAHGAEALTTTGAHLGTPAYMSPEQAAGDPDVDGRSDIYSLATTTYEMLAGAPPFRGPTPKELIAQRILYPAPSIRAAWSDAPEHVANAIAMALEREPDARPATATAFAALLRDSGASAAASRDERAAVTVAPHRFTQETTGERNMPSVGVLPFANVGASADTEFFCDGLTEEIIGALGRLRTIRVAGRGSTFALKGRALAPLDAAQRLRVSTILDGSVRRAGTRVRVSAQLVDGEMGYEIWSDQFDHELTDAFELQAEIATAIAAALGASLAPAAAAPRVSGDAYETFLRGRYALSRRTELALREAVLRFESAVSEDPDFAAAWAGLGESRALLALYGVVAPRTIMPAARDAAHAALRLDPTLPEAHSTLGTVAALYDWNWRASQDAFRRALTLAPRSAAVHQRCAVDLLVPQRRFAEARDAIDRARTLDTLNVAVQASAGVVRYLSGDLAAAVDELRRVTNVYPDFAVGHYFLAAVLRDAGEYRDAGDAIERAIARDGGGSPEMIAARAQILARSGRVDDARAALGQLDDWERGGRPVSALRAQLHLALGEPAPALAALERAADAREAELIYLGARPVYQSLRNEPAFQSLLRRIGLP